MKLYIVYQCLSGGDDWNNKFVCFDFETAQKLMHTIPDAGIEVFEFSVVNSEIYSEVVFVREGLQY